MANFLYNDNSVPFGSRVETVKRGGTGSPTEIGTFIFESISLTFPSKIGERPNEIGQPNGWWVVNGFEHGTAVLQVPTEAAEWPKIGDWFEDIFDGSGVDGLTPQHWVIVEVTQPYSMNDYWKCNVNLRLAINPPA